MNNDFKFMLYRLNKVPLNTLGFEVIKKRFNDSDIDNLISVAAHERYDKLHITKSAHYSWSLRNPIKFLTDTGDPELTVVIFARSTLSHETETIVEEGLAEAVSISNPPPAESMRILFYWKRHMVLVENRSAMTTGETWLKHFKSIIDSVAVSENYQETFELEQISPEKKVVEKFMSFDTIQRVRASIRLPNPDLNRYTKLLKEKLETDHINELTQDMTSYSGLSKDAEGMPYAVVNLVNDGYKSGPIIIEGNIKGQYERYESDKSTSKGQLSGLKSFLKGLGVNATTKEGKRILEAVENEVERLCPKED